MRTKEESAAYMRLRTARSKLALVRARIELGRDIASGMKPDEVATLAELRVKIENARYEAAARAEEQEIVDNAFEDAVYAIISCSRSGSTPEFDAELDDILRYAQTARDDWEQAKEQAQAQDMMTSDVN